MNRVLKLVLLLMAMAMFNVSMAEQATDQDAALSGEQLFIACIGCHDISADGVNKVGPNLHGIIGQQAGNVEGFKYSPALVEAGEKTALTWQAGTLMGWILQTEAMVPGTWMLYNNTLSTSEVLRLVDYIIKESSH